MKKLVRRTLAAMLAVILTASVCVFVVPAATTIAGDVVYDVPGVFRTLTFNPANGYIAVPFTYDGNYAESMANIKLGAAADYTGSSSNVASPGAINGSYFDMSANYGLLNGSNMTNGQMRAWASPWQFTNDVGLYYEPYIVFYADGKIDYAESHLDFHATVGDGFACDISYINKPASYWADVLYYFDYNGPDYTTPTMSTAGNWCIVKKDSANLNIGIGYPYSGTVQRVVKNAKSCSIAEDEFALYLGGTGYFTDLVGGEKVVIRGEETNPDYKDVMEGDIIGLMQCTGHLIKDGVDQTKIYSYIGPAGGGDSANGHSVNLTRGWTGMGITADGSVVMIVSQGQTTMSAMATQLMDLGCVTAFRMDGGGSSEIVAGSSTYTAESGRAVSEIVSIVNTSMMDDSSSKAELGTLIAQAEELLGTDGTVEIVAAKEAYNGTVSAMQKRYIGILLDTLSGKGMLESIVNTAKDVDIDTLGDYAADAVQVGIIEGTRLVNNASSTDEDCQKLAVNLNKYLNGSYNAGKISLGAAYKSGTVNPSYPDNGGKELTNADLYDTPNGNTNDRWVGFLRETASGSNSSGAYTEVYMDLGETKEITAASVSARNHTGYGISAPSKVEVLASNDGSTFSKFMTLESIANPVTGADQVLLYTGEGTVTARYFVFRAYFNGNHIFLGEVSLYGAESEAVGFDKVEALNEYINGSYNYTMFTTDFATTLTASNANLTWSESVVCDYDATIGAYVITDIVKPAGSSNYSITVPDDGFVMAYWGTGVNAPSTIAVGDYAYITGINLTTLKLDAMARIAFKAPTDVVVGDYEVLVGIIGAGNGIASPDDDYIRLHGTVTVTQLISVSADKGITVTIGGKVVTGDTVVTNDAIITDSTGVTYIAYVFGDVNGDNKLNQFDYIALKRAYMGNYTIEEGTTQMKCACVSGGATIKTLDYVMLKRYFLGSYKLP